MLDDGWFGARDDDTTRRSATGSSTGASCPTASTASPRRSRRWASTSGCGSSPRWSAERSQLFEAHPDWAIGIPGRPRTESRQQLVLDLSRAGGRRPPRSASCPRSSSSAPISYVKWDMNRTITEPYSLGLAARPPGRVLPPLHPRRLRAVRAADGGLPGRSCSSRARAAAAGSTRACSPTRRRPGRATTPTRSSGCGSSGATSLVYPLSSMGAHVSAVPNHQTGRITPIDDAGRGRVLRGLRLRAGPDRADRRASGPRSPTRSRSTRSIASCSSAAGSSACAARSRATATRRPGWSSRPTGRARSSVVRAHNGPAAPADRLRLRGLDPSADLPGLGWPRPRRPDLRANAGVRGGDELMAVGLSLAADRHEAAAGATSAPGCSCSRRGHWALTDHAH